MIRRRTFVAAALVAVTVFAGSTSTGATPGPDEEAAAEAAEAIQAARDEANAAAADFFEAQSELEQLADEAARLEREQAELEDQVEALRRQVEDVAVNRFLASGSSGIPILTDFREPSEQLQVDVLVGVATDSSADAMDEYDRLFSELESTRDAVADNQAELDAKRAEATALQQAAEEEVVHLQRVEEQRLEDERVYLAFLARQAEEARQREEQRKREEAEAAARAEAEYQAALARQAAEEQAAREAASAAEAAAAQDAADQAAREAADAAAAAAAAAAEEANRPVAPAPEASSGDAAASSGSGSGDGGGSGGGPAVAAVAGGGGGGGLVCPVAGSSSYHDGWGNPRSGGRRHEGVDMMASTGTPLVAVVSGSVTFKQNSLGGNAVWLRGSNGDSYYYAHLSSFEGSSRSVGQGEVIGYVGSTGNAGVPHLHFEVHPGGGAAVNPYPYVVAAGC